MIAKQIIKTKSLVLVGMLTFMAFGIWSCGDEIEKNPEPENIVPQTFTVAIPPALTNGPSSGRLSGRTSMDEDFSGNDVYELLGLFIDIGENSAELVEGIMGGVSAFGLNKATTFSYASDEDGRTKNAEVLEGSQYEGVNYEYALLITDADSEDSQDGGHAMQVFWNTSPVNGVALLKPININRNDDDGLNEAIFRIDYSEIPTNGYEAHMIVSIVNLPQADPEVDQFSIDNLKMFVGKSGEIVDVYGNSNHPNASFFEASPGFSWSFVASGIDNQDIGVAEVGLPPSTLDATERDAILVDYSIKQVFSDLIEDAFPDIGQELLDQLLMNTEAPGFFNESGFIQGGTSPSSEFDPLTDRIKNLTPYNPKDISALTVEFK